MQIKNEVLQMKRLMTGMLAAKEQQGKSVVYMREEIIEEAVMALTENPHCTLVPFGVKDTHQIPRAMVEKLQQVPGFLFHTIDKMARGGRAIDVDLLNPLTGKVMTGSTSGGCVNILRGINDLSLGTDGGGSVLAPAISTGLYSIMAKGMGLRGSIPRRSTDNLSFLPGIGLISHDFQLCKGAASQLLDLDLAIVENSLKKESITVAIPKAGQGILPNGRDMVEYLQRVLERTRDWIRWMEFDIQGLVSRQDMIDCVKALFEAGVDMILTAEGPIDLYGSGDSVLGQWGPTGADLQQRGGKYLLKVANMVDATAVTLPTEDLGVGLLLMGPRGIGAGSRVIALGNVLQSYFKPPALFERYFIQGGSGQGFL
ncbi:hypothetical protein [Alkaliphilus crotonatoxidans]